MFKHNERWRNKGLWLAIASLVFMVLQDMGVSITPAHYQNYVNAILTIVVFLGVVNDPNLGEWFEDTDEE